MSSTPGLVPTCASVRTQRRSWDANACSSLPKNPTESADQRLTDRLVTPEGGHHPAGLGSTHARWETLMTTTLLTPRGRIALAATTTVMAVVAIAPPVQAMAPSSVAALAAGIDLRGGDATSKMVCGNVADAQDYADAHNLVIQKNNCHPKATGGDIELSNV